jgi:hypothetical protein
MTKKFLLASLLFGGVLCNAQTNPAITSWLQNATQTGTYYVSGNSTAISNDLLVNCQSVEYSADYAYIKTKGIPAYPTGPFSDGNPSNAEDQDAIFQIPLNPVQNTGSASSTVSGNIGVFINGVALFDYRDGVAWNNSTSALCGGPGNSPCPGGPTATQDWNRDAIPAEKDGFDCSKAHPAMGNYHHHQNPSAFKLDLNVVSTICNLYDADGLYAIDSVKHAPLIGYAYDGFPIYGAYAYKNVDGTGEITRMKSGYNLTSVTTRTNGPDVDATYINGYFREDYEHTTNVSPDYLDEHNGRFCITPEYPNGIYCYFATVDQNWNSTYPYVVGPTFYGVYDDRKVSVISEATTEYVSVAPTSVSELNNDQIKVNIFPNPSTDFIAIQLLGLNSENLDIELLDVTGKIVNKTTLNQGATNTYLDTKTLYSGNYLVRIIGSKGVTTKKIMISK